MRQPASVVSLPNFSRQRKRSTADPAAGTTMSLIRRRLFAQIINNARAESCILARYEHERRSRMITDGPCAAQTAHAVNVRRVVPRQAGRQRMLSCQDRSGRWRLRVHGRIRDNTCQDRSNWRAVALPKCPKMKICVKTAQATLRKRIQLCPERRRPPFRPQPPDRTPPDNLQRLPAA